MANGEFLTVPKIRACFRLLQLDRRCSTATMLQCNSSHYGLQVMVVILCTCLSVCLYVTALLPALFTLQLQIWYCVLEVMQKFQLS